MNSLPSVKFPCKVAILFPSLERGFYWHPVFAEMTKLFPEMVVFTGQWTGFSKNQKNAFLVKAVGKFYFLKFSNAPSGYDRGIILPSLRIIPMLCQFKPNVIMTSAFSLWTFFVVFLKPIFKWKTVVIFDGISPNPACVNPKLRTYWRKFISFFSDAFVTNSQTGKNYLIQHLGVKGERVFARPYEIADPAVFKDPHFSRMSVTSSASTQRPTFLFVGQLIPRKGVFNLLRACQLLKGKGYSNWSLIIVGDGPLRKDLESFSNSLGIEERIFWVGWIKNEKLPNYFQAADVFVFPTLEDIWGVTVLEAMSSKMPILCSKWAGASELIEQGSNGYSFDPHMPEELADLMRLFIDDTSLIIKMGEHAGKSIESLTPEITARHLSQVILSVTQPKYTKPTSE